MGAHIVETAREDELAEIVRIIGPAFVDDPLMDRLFPRLPRHEQTQRYQEVEHANIAVFYRGAGAVHVGRDASGRPVTLAAWGSPLRPRTRLSDFAPHAGRAVRAIGRWAVPVLGTDLTYQRLRPDEPHWYLHLLATDASARGTGITSAVLRHGLAAVDASHAPAYLEASGDWLVPLYEHFGFRVCGTIEPVRGSQGIPMFRPAVGRR